MKTNLFVLLFLFFGITFSFSQQDIWRPINESEVSGNEKIRRSSFPKTYQTFELDIESLKKQLVGVPIRGNNAPDKTHTISLPNAEGKLERFDVIETPIMESALAEKFPSTVYFLRDKKYTSATTLLQLPTT